MTKQQHINAIARKHLSIETLETRRSDRLDFHEVAVWGVQAALDAAYEAGRHDRADRTAGDAVGMTAAIADAISPEAFVVIAAYLQNAQANDPEIACQVRWFADLLIETVGTDTYNRTLDELGL